MSRSSIDQRGDLGIGYAGMNEGYEFCFEAHFLKDREEERVPHYVEGINKIMFQKKSLL